MNSSINPERINAPAFLETGLQVSFPETVRRLLGEVSDAATTIDALTAIGHAIDEDGIVAVDKPGRENDRSAVAGKYLGAFSLIPQKAGPYQVREVRFFRPEASDTIALSLRQQDPSASPAMVDETFVSSIDDGVSKPSSGIYTRAERSYSHDTKSWGDPEITTIVEIDDSSAGELLRSMCLRALKHLEA